jgi:hypothetical protein
MKNIQTKSRHHFPVGLLESFESDVNDGSAEPPRVAFIMWDKAAPSTYSVVFYQGGHQTEIREYTRSLDWVEPQDTGPQAA